jgi:hypothetical protein
MNDRLRHALRCALCTLLAVYAVGLVWELLDTFALGDVADGLSASATFAFNEGVWRVIAIVEAIVVFLLRLGDLRPRRPTWRFAAALALWLAVTSVVVSESVQQGAWTIAIVTAIVALVAWLWLHRRLPLPSPDATQGAGGVLLGDGAGDGQLP